MNYNNADYNRRPVSYDGSRPPQYQDGQFGSQSASSAPQRASSDQGFQYHNQHHGQPSDRSTSLDLPPSAAGTGTGTGTGNGGPSLVRPGNFQRRPTNLSEKAVRKGVVPGIDKEGNEVEVNDHVNLEGGLDIILNCEVSQKDPAGITTPYRLLVPALWYDGSSDREKLDGHDGVAAMRRKPTLMKRMGIGRKRGGRSANGEGEGKWGPERSETESYSGSEGTEEEHRPRRVFGLFGSRRRRQDQDEMEEQHQHQHQPQHQPQQQQQKDLPGGMGGQFPREPYSNGPRQGRPVGMPTNPHGSGAQYDNGSPPARREERTRGEQSGQGFGRNESPEIEQQRTAGGRPVSDKYQSTGPGGRFGRDGMQGPPPRSQGQPYRDHQERPWAPPGPKYAKVLGEEAQYGHGRWAVPGPSYGGDPGQASQYQGGASGYQEPNYGQGYGGVEAYREPKARKRWSLRGARRWVGDGGSPSPG